MESESIDSHDVTGDKERFNLLVGSDYHGLRLDHYLVDHLKGYSRSQLTHSVKKGLVQVNGSAAKASRKLHQGDTVRGCIEQPAPLEIAPQKIDFEILYEDEYLIGVSKPPGLVVHPADGNPDNTLVNGLVYYCHGIQQVGDTVRPGIVHRLDKDTSGVIVVAKKNNVHRMLVEAFKSRKVKKKYHALAVGVMDGEQGRIVASIGRHPVDRKKMAVRERAGKHAATNWWLEKIIGNSYSLLKIEIETGRTHQIRVHLASIGSPVAGDHVYGSKKKSALFPRQMLHSSELSLTHPVTGRKLKLSAPLWSDMLEALNFLGCDPEQT